MTMKNIGNFRLNLSATQGERRKMESLTKKYCSSK